MSDKRTPDHQQTTETDAQLLDRRGFIRDAIVGGTTLAIGAVLLSQKGDDTTVRTEKQERGEELEDHAWTPEHRTKVFATERKHEFFRLALPDDMAEWLEANGGPMFSPEDQPSELLCMDGRIKLRRGQYARRIGGSGIVYAYDRQSNTLNYNRAINLLGPHAVAGRIRGIRNHRCGCGACAIVAREMARGGVAQNGDDLGEQWSQGLAQRLGVPYLGQADMEHGFEHGHPETVIFYDATQRMQDTRWANFPHGLVIHRWNDVAYAQRELSVAGGIVLDPEHGIGMEGEDESGRHVQLISPQQPVYILASGKDRAEASLAGFEASQVARRLNHEHDDAELFKVIPYVAPRAM